jgi:hypothetical protein
MTGPIAPVPGDPSTEQVATGLQSHTVGKRVGPQTIAEDEAAPWHTLGATQVAPGAPVDPAFPTTGAPPAVAAVAELGAGPYGSDTPADESPATIKATTPGEDGPGEDELPPGTPLPTHAASASSLTPTGTATSGGSDTPTSPGDSPASSSSSTSAEGDPAGADDGSAESSGTSDSDDSAESKTTSKTSTRKR